MFIPLCYNPSETPQCHGGFADVWKGQYHSMDVAAKALRVYLTSDFERIRKAGCPRLLCFKNLTAFRAEVLERSCDMEGPSSPERVAAAGRDHGRDPFRDGIGVDGKREHQRICEGGDRHRSAGTCLFLAHGSHFPY